MGKFSLSVSIAENIIYNSNIKVQVSNNMLLLHVYSFLFIKKITTVDWAENVIFMLDWLYAIVTLMPLEKSLAENMYVACIVAINIESTVMQSDDETIKNTQNVLSFRVI